MSAQTFGRIQKVYLRYKKELTDAKDYMFWFLLVWTAVFLYLEWMSFFAPEIVVPPAMVAGYTILLGSYIGHKELIRWMGIELKVKRGELFVYIWWGSFLLMFLVQYWTGNNHLPEDIPMVPYEVLGYFLLSEASKATLTWRRLKRLESKEDK
jgi:hypothetical protein